MSCLCIVCLFTELQQNVNCDKELTMTMAAHLNNYGHLARLEQLMQEKSKLTMSVIECMPLGPPHIGKTCSKDRLAEKKPKKNRLSWWMARLYTQVRFSMSTGAVEGVMKIVVETTYLEQGKQWVQHTFNQEIVSFIRGAETSHFSTQVQPSRLSSIPKQEQPETQSGTHKMQSILSEKQSSTHGTNHANRPSSFSKQENQSSTSSAQVNDSSAAIASHLSHDPPQVRYGPPEIISKALLHEGSSQVQSLEGSLMIHFTDTGGLNDFHKILPALVSSLCFSLPAVVDHQ